MTDTADAPTVVRPPRTIVLAFAAAIAHVVLSILNSAMLWGFQDYLRGQLIDSNNKAKASDKKDYSNTPQGLHNLNHDLHSGLNVGLIQIAIFGLLVILLAVSFRKGRGWARWAEILVLVIVVQAPFRLLNLGGHAPILMRLVSGLVGLTGVAVIILLVLPESSRYFAAVKGATPRRDGAAPGWRDLLRPRPRPSTDSGRAPARGSANTPVRTPARTSSARTPAKAQATSAKSPASAAAKASAKAPADDATKPQPPSRTSPANARRGKQPATAADNPDSVTTDRRPRAKARAGVDAAPSSDSAKSLPGAAKSRGKSRRSS